MVAEMADESRINYWLVAGVGVHALTFWGMTLGGGWHEANPSQRFADGRRVTNITEVEIWESPSPVNRPALRAVPIPKTIEPGPPLSNRVRAVEERGVESRNASENGTPAGELSPLAPVESTAPSMAPQRKPLDLGITDSSFLVVGPELSRAPQRDQYENAERKLNQHLSRETLMSDSLTRQSLEGAVRRALLDVARILPLQGTRIVVCFTLTHGGTIDFIGVPISQGLSANIVSRLIEELKSRSLPMRPRHPIEYTFELTDSVRTATGRTAGSRLSLGGFEVGASALDSPELNILPRKWTFQRARKLSRNGDGQFEQDPESSAYLEQRVLETNVDPVDILGGTRRELRARLIRSRVL